MWQVSGVLLPYQTSVRYWSLDIYTYISEENKFGIILLPIIEKQAVIDSTGEINLKFIVCPMFRQPMKSEWDNTYSCVHGLGCWTYKTPMLSLSQAWKSLSVCTTKRKKSRISFLWPKGEHKCGSLPFLSDMIKCYMSHWPKTSVWECNFWVANLSTLKSRLPFAQTKNMSAWHPSALWHVSKMLRESMAKSVRVLVVGLSSWPWSLKKMASCPSVWDFSVMIC